MKFLYKTFEAKKKEIIEVDIDKPTKVKFMTAREFKPYKNGRSHTYFGGLYEESPIRFVVPHDSVWTVVVEKGTHHAPVDLQAKCALIAPNDLVSTSVATDAPVTVREAVAQEAERVRRIAEEMNLAARSEG